MNGFMVRPEINAMTDLRRKQLVVDAPHTACALVAKRILCSMACWKTAITAPSWPEVRGRDQQPWWLIHNWQRLGSTRRFRSRFEKKV